MTSDADQLTAPTRSGRLTRPLWAFRTASIAEAITWTLLLIGMFGKYVTHTTELGVRVFGTLHGAVFLAYCVTVVLVAIDQRWPLGRTVLALACAIPPFATLAFDRWVEKRALIGDAWRLRSASPGGPLERLAGWALNRPVLGALLALILVAALFTVALILGPPVGG